MIIYYLAETNDDGVTFKHHTKLGYWTDVSKAKAKAKQLNEAMGELSRFEVFAIFPYEIPKKLKKI